MSPSSLVNILRMEKEDRRKKFDSEHPQKKKPTKTKLFVRTQKGGHTESLTRAERFNVFIEMKMRGCSLEQIGKEFGVTRERVRQILQRAPAETRVLFKRPYKERVHTNCALCGKELEVPASAALKNKTGKFYCNRTHMMQYYQARRIDQKAYQRNRIKDKYHNDPLWLVKFKEQQARSRLRRMERAKTDPVFAERLRAVQRRASERWLEKKKKTDPGFFERKKYRNLSREQKDKVLLKYRNHLGKKRNAARKQFEDAYTALQGGRKTQVFACKHSEFRILGSDTIALKIPEPKKGNKFTHIHICEEVVVLQRHAKNQRIYIFP